LKRLQHLIQSALIRAQQKTNFGRTSYPFISGDAFKKLADSAIACNKDLEAITNPKVLFMSSDFFVKNPGILDRFSGIRVLIIGNGDVNFLDSNLFSQNFGLVLCQNLSGPLNERLRTLPIGLENRKLGKSGLPRYFKHQNHDNLYARNLKVLIPPMSPTNPARQKFDFNSSDLSMANVVSFNDYLPTRKYFSLVRKYRFILCLEGNGFDTHRVWEALYLECFPVVLNTPWSQDLVKMGLPILIVDSISNITIENLLQFQDDHRDFCSLETPQLWMPHWERIVSEALR